MTQSAGTDTKETGETEQPVAAQYLNGLGEWEEFVGDDDEPLSIQLTEFERETGRKVRRLYAFSPSQVRRETWLEAAKVADDMADDDRALRAQAGKYDAKMRGILAYGEGVARTIAGTLRSLANQEGSHG